MKAFIFLVALLISSALATERVWRRWHPNWLKNHPDHIRITSSVRNNDLVKIYEFHDGRIPSCGFAQAQVSTGNETLTISNPNNNIDLGTYDPTQDFQDFRSRALLPIPELERDDTPIPDHPESAGISPLKNDVTTSLVEAIAINGTIRRVFTFLHPDWAATHGQGNHVTVTRVEVQNGVVKRYQFENGDESLTVESPAERFPVGYDPSDDLKRFRRASGLKELAKEKVKVTNTKIADALNLSTVL
ncbi:hypothetical protein PAPYR_11750 [Paratrimastix pyriformis]|uniref:Uncharacterized protein n=1 Tax=Paratrimastix pyriformis TaxID=342808 RepID=A0ABQ8U4U6_9EUKA|nr:hypothetical protein PAPYR_11750 [Paratrimastix pyriformis]